MACQSPFLRLCSSKSTTTKNFLPDLTRLKRKYNYPNQCRLFSTAHGRAGFLVRNRRGGRAEGTGLQRRAGCPELPAGIPGGPRSWPGPHDPSEHVTAREGKDDKGRNMRQIGLGPYHADPGHHLGAANGAARRPPRAAAHRDGAGPATPASALATDPTAAGGSPVCLR